MDGHQRALVKLSKSAEGPALLGRVGESQPKVHTAGGLLIAAAHTREADVTRAQMESTAEGQTLLRQVDAQPTRHDRPGIASGDGFLRKVRQATAEQDAQKVGPGSSCISRRTPLPPLPTRDSPFPPPGSSSGRLRFAPCPAHSQPDAPRGRYGHTASTGSSWCSWYLRQPVHQWNLSSSDGIDMGTFRSWAQSVEFRFTRGSLRFRVT
jgi:hypothetical protein